MKKILRITSIFLVITVILFCMIACANNDQNENIKNKIETINDNFHNEWSELRPLTVDNYIVITDENGSELVRYSKKYVLLEDNTGKIYINTVYLGDENNDLNNVQEMYYYNNRIAMKYNDINGEVTKNYEADIDTFMTLVADGANNVFQYNYVYEYFENVISEELQNATKITFNVKDENICDFLGEDVQNISNMSFSYVLYLEVSRMMAVVAYDTVNGDSIAHVSATVIASQEGEVNIPDWAM